MSWSRTMAASALLGALAIATPAAADKPAKNDAREGRKEAREAPHDAKGAKDGKDAKDAKDPKDAKKELGEARKELRDALRDGGPGSQAAKDAREDVDDARKALREGRHRRAKAKKAELETRWGGLLAKAPVKQELRLHAMRMAKLHRMQQLAKEKGLDAVAKRVDALVAKENARHDRRMNQLETQGGDERPNAPPAASGEKPEEKKP